MARAKSKAGEKRKPGYLSKKHRAMLRRGKRMEKAAKMSKKKERNNSGSFVPEPKDLGAMMRKQQEYNAQMEMNNMGNNSEADRKFTNMMRKHQNRVTKEKIGIFRRQTPIRQTPIRQTLIRQTPTRAHGMKKSKKARGKKKSKKSSKNNNRK